MSDRWYANQTCALKQCSKPLRQGDAVAVLPTEANLLRKVATQKDLLVTWQADRQAFHLECYEQIPSLKASRIERRLLNAGKDTIEYYHQTALIDEAVNTVAQLMASKKCCIFTGAGISANAGIPTYRGTAGIDLKQEMNQDEEEEEFSYSQLQPTVAHLGVNQLVKHGFVQGVITQNCDSLHTKAGVPTNNMVELHGNVFVEFCERCHKEYVRDYEVDAYSTTCNKEPWYEQCRACKWNHYTGRKCDACKGKLKDTIVNFGDDLHESVLGGLPKAEKLCAESDVLIALGSSLLVSPANELTLLGKRLVIVNLQTTPLDIKATVLVRCPADEFIHKLTAKLVPNSNKQHQRKKQKVDK